MLVSVCLYLRLAAVTAGYYMSFKMVKNEESSIVKGFGRLSKRTSGKSTALWLIFYPSSMRCAVLWITALSCIPALSFDRWLRLGILLRFTLIICIGSILCICDARHVSQDTVKHTLKNSFLMALSHLPSAVLFGVSYAVPLYCCILSRRYCRSL